MMHEESGILAADEREVADDTSGLEYRINGVVNTVNKRKVTGRELLATAGFAPAPDYTLIMLFEFGTRSIGLDETIELSRGTPTLFRAFQSDRAFNFTLDDRGCEWGATIIHEHELREIGQIPESNILVLKRKHEPDLELEDGQAISLDGNGTEHFESKTSLILVYLDGVEKRIHRGTYSTEELAAALGVEAGYVLDVVTPDGQLEALKPGEKIRVRKGMKFISQAPCGGSS